MTGKTINPTRMELTRLKGRLKTAQRGHKLLKDKRDELMKQFMEVVRRNRQLRAKVEQGLKEANAAFTVASAIMGPEMLEQSLLCPRRSVSLEVGSRNIMSVNTPVYTFHTEGGDDALLPYGFAQTSGELDAALEKILLDVLDTPVSPELLPTAADGTISQQTEKLVGPYELHDFYLYYVLRFGFSPTKIYHLARTAFDGKYEPEVLLAWLKNFYRRFFAQQFKRSCLPDGPKVGSVTLSPRGDWRMPSDACNTLWMAELDKLDV